MKYLSFILLILLLIGCNKSSQSNEYKDVIFFSVDEFREKYEKNPELYDEIIADIQQAMRRQKDYQRFIVIDPNVLEE